VNAKKRIVKVKTDSLRVGHELMTPISRLPYRVMSIADKYAYNDTRRKWERQAVCMWIDTGVTFKTYFPDYGFKTLIDE
jgi:hypothetical protein